jgi:hypothetical protein
MLRTLSQTLIVMLLFFAAGSLSGAQSVSIGDDGAVSGGTHADRPRPADNSGFGDQDRASGNLSGTVLDQSGAVMVGAHVHLTRDNRSPGQDVVSGENGQFSFSEVTPGFFQLTIASAGFTTHVVSGVLSPGEAYLVPTVVLMVANAVSEVWVKSAPLGTAEAQLQEQEKQRVFGIIPNFYVSYLKGAAPLSPKQKFRLAWKSLIDPFTPVGVGVLAGFEQATDALPGYGQGAQGYAKRFGASYADVVAGTFIGSAILPSLLKQDPRYFYKGNGNTASRLLYALASPVICKGDNHRWQPNYSNILGSFAAGGISYLYYPASDRSEPGSVSRVAMIRLGETALEGVLQEFLIPRLTPHHRRRAHS